MSIEKHYTIEILSINYYPPWCVCLCVLTISMSIAIIIISSIYSFIYFFSSNNSGKSRWMVWYDKSPYISTLGRVVFDWLFVNHFRKLLPILWFATDFFLSSIWMPEILRWARFLSALSLCWKIGCPNFPVGMGLLYRNVLVVCSWACVRIASLFADHVSQIHA